MKRTLICASALLTLGASVALARTIDVWGQTFEVGDTQPMTLDVGAIGDGKGGHHMNYVKLKNGHMMALVPMENYMAFYQATNPGDMLK